VATRVYRGHPGPGVTVTAEALVASDNFSARYDLDLARGIFSRPSHALAGQSYVGKVLVLDLAKGGVATAWMLREMVESGRAPAALVLNFANPIMAQGAVFAGLALIDRFDVDITTVVRTREMVTVDPAAGTLAVAP
jgi:predicted aconitase with swiveling domain